MDDIVADVAIVGCGITGLALALGLAKRGVRPVLIGRAPRVSTATQQRPIALAKGSQRILARFGVWRHLAPAAQPIASILVSEKGRFAKVRLSAEEMGADAFGYVSDAFSIQGACRRALDALGAVVRICEGELGSVQWYRDGVMITLADTAQTIRVALAVGADGGGSTLRQIAAIGTRLRDFEQSALTCVVRAQKPVARQAFERFTRQGPLALLPMGNGQYGLVWCVEHRQADVLQNACVPAFATELSRVFGRTMGCITPCSQVARFDLQSVRAERVVGQRLVLVGNAAHQLHPVAGQGLNLGLRDVDELSALVGAACHEDGADCGGVPLLQAYEHRRAADHRRVQWTTDTLAGLFCSKRWPLSLARQGGLFALQMLPFAKRVLARTAMGLLHPIDATCVDSAQAGEG